MFYAQSITKSHITANIMYCNHTYNSESLFMTHFPLLKFLENEVEGIGKAEFW